VTSAGSIAKAVALTGGYGLPEDALELLRDEISWALDLAEARGRSNERAAVVVWLRGQAEMAYDNTDAHHALWRAAETVERGEHRREEKP